MSNQSKNRLSSEEAEAEASQLAKERKMPKMMALENVRRKAVAMTTAMTMTTAMVARKANVKRAMLVIASAMKMTTATARTWIANNSKAKMAKMPKTAKMAKTKMRRLTRLMTIRR